VRAQLLPQRHAAGAAQQIQNKSQLGRAREVVLPVRAGTANGRRDNKERICRGIKILPQAFYRTKVNLKRMTENREKLRRYLEKIGDRLEFSPAGVFNDVARAVYHEYVRARYSDVLKKNASLKNIYSENDRCFLVGNGPSLVRQDLSLLANEHVFVVNWFHKHKLYHKISPEYHVHIAPLFPDFFWGGISSKQLGWRRELEEAIAKTRGRTKLFLSLNQIEQVAKNRLFKNVDVYYLLPSLAMERWGIRKIDLTGGIPSRINSIYLCMLMAYYMGFRKMILIGCDCSLAAGTSYTHFYGPEPDSPPKVTPEQALKYSSELFKGYRIIGNFLASKGCKVYNATDGGFLEVFPRVKYEQLFK